MTISIQKEARSRDYSLQKFQGFLSSTKYHRQHCTPQAVEQFGALYYAQPQWQISDPAGIRTPYLWVSSHSRIESITAFWLYRTTWRTPFSLEMRSRKSHLPRRSLAKTTTDGVKKPQRILSRRKTLVACWPSIWDGGQYLPARLSAEDSQAVGERERNGKWCFSGDFRSSSQAYIPCPNKERFNPFPANFTVVRHNYKWLKIVII